MRICAVRHTHNFVTHSLSHTTFTRTIFHTQPCHNLSFTHNFVTHQLSLSHAIFHIHFITHNSALRSFSTQLLQKPRDMKLPKLLAEDPMRHVVWQRRLICFANFLKVRFCTGCLDKQACSREKILIQVNQRL